jgi:hypothetical protein
VTDNVTGLAWQQATAPGTYTQPAAASYCQGLALAGYGGWRLPTKIELESIVDLGRANPSINVTAFPGTQSTNYWTSKALAGSTNLWVVDFSSGGSSSDAGSFTHPIRCVR